MCSGGPNTAPQARAAGNTDLFAHTSGERKSGTPVWAAVSEALPLGLHAAAFSLCPHMCVSVSSFLLIYRDTSHSGL